MALVFVTKPRSFFVGKLVLLGGVPIWWASAYNYRRCCGEAEPEDKEKQKAQHSSSPSVLQELKTLALMPSLRQMLWSGSEEFHQALGGKDGAPLEDPGNARVKRVKEAGFFVWDSDTIPGEAGSRDSERSRTMAKQRDLRVRSEIQQSGQKDKYDIKTNGLPSPFSRVTADVEYHEHRDLTKSDKKKKKRSEITEERGDTLLDEHEKMLNQLQVARTRATVDSGRLRSQEEERRLRIEKSIVKRRKMHFSDKSTTTNPKPRMGPTMMLRRWRAAAARAARAAIRNTAEKKMDASEEKLRASEAELKEFKGGGQHQQPIFEKIKINAMIANKRLVASGTGTGWLLGLGEKQFVVIVNIALKRLVLSRRGRRRAR